MKQSKGGFAALTQRALRIIERNLHAHLDLEGLGMTENNWTMAAQPALEFHNSTFDPSTGEGGLTIWLPVVENAYAARNTIARRRRDG